MTPLAQCPVHTETQQMVVDHLEPFDCKHPKPKVTNLAKLGQYWEEIEALKVFQEGIR